MRTRDQEPPGRRRRAAGAAVASAAGLLTLLLPGTASAADHVVPAAADGSPGLAGWLLVALVGGLAGGLVAAAAVAVLTGRRAGRGPDELPGPAAAPPSPVEEVDDLPAFRESPPGSAARPAQVAAVGTASGATAAPRPAAPRPAATVSRRAVALVALVTVLLLVAVAVLVAVADRDGDPAAAGAPSTSLSTSPSTQPSTTPATGAPTGAPTGAAATPSDAGPSASSTAAAALALESVPLGADGVAASVSFQGVVLEQRAVGLTVAYPSLSVTSDGARSLAHVRLPTFNCLGAEPPADPEAAGCSRSLVEYADLASPQLQVSHDGDQVDLVGLFPTYTRPNGSAPGYTGRAYQLTATITAEGPPDDGDAPATGVVRIGLDSAATTAERGVNLLQRSR